MNSNNEKAASQLQDVRQWAKDKIAKGDEPPWAWYQYMKLIETIDAILVGESSTITMENSQQLGQPRNAHLQLVDATYQQENAQPHPSGLPVIMPI